MFDFLNVGTGITVLSFIVVLGILVFLHELGHYWVARRHGIVVEEFGMGYPPRLVKLFTYNGTDFTINLIPFGGFARMKGEDAGDLAPGSFNAASRKGRALTLLAGPAMNAVIAVILFAASFMAGFPAPAGRPQVIGVEPGTVAASIGVQDGDLLLELHAQPVQVSPSPQLSYNVLAEKPANDAGGSLLISRNGQMQTLDAPAGLKTSDLLEGVEYAPVLITQISLVTENSPAYAAGLLPDDLVYAVNDTTISLDAQLSDVIREYAGEEITMSVLRDSQWHEIKAVPRVDPPPGEGALGIQIGFESTLATLSPLNAVWEGVRETGRYASLLLQLPMMLISGEMSPEEAQISGPVGIARFVGGAVEATMETGRWFPILRLTAILSAALAVTNMLPIPALDGGRLLFIAIEALRGRRLNPEKEGLVHMVGFLVLIGLLLFVTVQDFRMPQQGIDWVSIMGQ